MGVVTAVGEDVDVPIGTRVMATCDFIAGHGSFAEVLIGGHRSGISGARRPE